MRKFMAGFLGLAMATLLTAAIVRASEEKVPLNKIPKAVMDALKGKFPNAKIDKCAKEKEGDDTVYDIEFKVAGHKYEADIKENGDFVNYEKEIAAKDLPKAVKKAIDKKYPKATLKEVMEETEVKGKDEKLSAYEVVLVTADKKSLELRLSPDGKILEDSSEKKK